MNTQVKKSINVFVCLMLAVLQSAYASDEPAEVIVARHIAMEIDYGKGRPTRVAQHIYREGETALDILKAVAEVETHYAGIYNMVVGIDGVRGVRGDMAWYYRVDGKPAKQIAATFVPDGVDTIRWVYKTDVCSGTVDNK